MRWEDWFRTVGATPVKLKFAFRCSLYPDVIQATLHGQGVALGWARLLAENLKSGALVKLTDVAVKVPHAYFAVIPHGRTITATTQGLIDWIRNDALGAEPGAPQE